MLKQLIKYSFKITTLIVVLSLKANAQQVTAIELQENCKQVQRGSVGKYYNQVSAQKCSSYMDGFFDSMIILARLTKKDPFCIPDSLPKTQNTTILDQWIIKNPKTAETTTASVALYAAFKIAFNCNKQNVPN